MLAIKLARKGKTGYPVYRLIVLEKTKDIYGDYLENLGTYNPHTKEADIKTDRVKHWISQGAQPTETVHNLLIEKGVIEGEKVRASKSKPGKKKRAQQAAEKSEEKKKESTADKPVEEKKEAAPQAEVKADNQSAEAAAEKPIEEPKAEVEPQESKEAAPAQDKAQETKTEEEKQ